MRTPIFLLLCAAFLFVHPSNAQEADLRQYRLIPDEIEETDILGEARISTRTQLPVVLYSEDFRSSARTPEAMARDYLQHRGAELGIASGGSDLQLQAVRKTPGGHRVRFIQNVDGIPVYRSGVAIVLDNAGSVRFVTNGYKSNLKVDVSASKTGPSQAIDVAKTFLESPQTQHESGELVVYAPLGAGRLAHRVDVVNEKGSWEVLVDAGSGEVFRSEPTSHLRDPLTFSKPGTASSTSSITPTSRPEHAQRVDGSGWVFDPDPMSTAGASYGNTSSFEDNDNADSEELTAQLQVRTLPDIAFDGSLHHLVGPYAQISDFNAPNRGTFSQASSDFHFTRSDPAFEAVNAYYHLDHSMRYLNETLGFEVEPIQYDGGVQFDPHWGEDTVNAQYLSTGQLRFGEGGVDAAEDGEIVLHELGHGIHDWVTDGNLGRLDGLSEGSSDYWAASYTRGLGLWNEGEQGFDTMGRWGLKPFFAGRTVDYSGNYPFDLTGAIHTDGQIWSSAVMAVWDELGKETTDLLFLEALSMLGTDSNTNDAARAIVLADSLLNGGANAQLVLDKMVERGFIYRAALAAVGRSGPPPRSVTFFDLSTFGSASATGWEWDYDSDGTVDNTSSFASNTYTTPGLHSVTLTATGAGRTETTTLTDYVSVNSGVYVWEGTGNTDARSGRFIADLLQDAGVETHYSRTPIIHPSLEGFDAVFLSFGPYAPQDPPVPLGQIPARTILEYLDAGGNVYLEGGDALGFNQAFNTDLLSTLGIQVAFDGSGDRQPVTNLRGQSGSIAESRRFTASAQTSVTSVDLYNPNSSGRAMFVEEGYGVVGVQNSNASGGRSVAMSYTLADLIDGESSKTEVLQDIVDFFGISATITDTEEHVVPERVALSPAYPNPFSQQATISFVLPRTTAVRLEVFDLLGRRVALLADDVVMSSGEHEIILDGSRLTSGMYVVRMKAGNQIDRTSIVKVR